MRAKRRLLRRVRLELPRINVHVLKIYQFHSLHANLTADSLTCVVYCALWDLIFKLYSPQPSITHSRAFVRVRCCDTGITAFCLKLIIS